MRRLFAATAIFAALVGCTTTTQEKVKMDAQVQGFMGDAYPLLKPGKEGQVELVYIAQGVDWKQYKGTLLEPVQFWAGSDSKITPDAQQMLATYLYNSLETNLGKVGVNLVDLPGPGIMRAQVAFTDVTKATPILRTVSVIVPQARVINQAQQLVTGSYGFSGSAEVALKVTDSKTGQLLAAAIDRRGGGGSIEQAAVWQWGDVQAAIDFWTQRFADRMVELREKAKAK
jgi:hypothetical protein